MNSIEVNVVEDSVRVLPSCTGCGLCARICPAINKPAGGPGFIEAYTARTTLSDVRERCQDGGVVSSILVWALESGYAKAAIVGGVSETEPLLPEPLIATSRADVVRSAGSRYTPSPNLALLKELSKAVGKGEAVLVGLPCQIRAFHNIRERKLLKYSNPIKLTVGLFCMESFPYRAFTEDILRGLLGADPREVKKVSIKKGALIVTMRDGKEKSVKVSELKGYMRGSCKTCTDLTSEFADISVGSIGSEVGWSTVLLRTEEGVRVFREVVSSGYLEAKPLSEASLKIVQRLSERKRKRGA